MLIPVREWSVTLLVTEFSSLSHETEYMPWIIKISGKLLSVTRKFISVQTVPPYQHP